MVVGNKCPHQIYHRLIKHQQHLILGVVVVVVVSPSSTSKLTSTSLSKVSPSSRWSRRRRCTTTRGLGEGALINVEKRVSDIELTIAGHLRPQPLTLSPPQRSSQGSKHGRCQGSPRWWQWRAVSLEWKDYLEFNGSKGLICLDIQAHRYSYYPKPLVHLSNLSYDKFNRHP